MNPERAGMLREIAAGGADRSLSPPAVHDPELGPRASGANVVGMRQASKGPEVPIKRSRSELESDGEDADIARGRRFDQRMWMRMRHPPIFRPRK